MKYKLQDLKNNDVIEALLKSDDKSDKFLAIYLQYKDIDETKLRKKIRVEYNKEGNVQYRCIRLENVKFYIDYSTSKKRKSVISVEINYHILIQRMELKANDKNTIMNFIYSFLKNELDE